jgi:hypothetical protein
MIIVRRLGRLAVPCPPGFAAVADLSWLLESRLG